jgi:formylglycine-generating enzyme required for sulfatase activity
LTCQSCAPLLPALCQLAFALQARRAPGEASRVRVPYDDALELLGDQQGEELLHAGVALQVLEVQWDDVFYVHQLLQEYFAARALAAAPQAELAASAWRADQISPTLDDVLAGLADSDPLPEAPSTGWEETFVLAAAMAHAPADFVSALMAVNLPLAGRCAAQPDVHLPDALRSGLQQALVERSREPAADLRARIAAARALGGLGDPRFTGHRGAYGDYLLPPLVDCRCRSATRSAATKGSTTTRTPVHPVQLASFSIAQFPVTNAEWRLFIAAGAYDDERWWEGKAAQDWRRGEGTAEGAEAAVAPRFRQWLRDDPQRIETPAPPEQRITSTQARGLGKNTAMARANLKRYSMTGIRPAGRPSPVTGTIRRTIDPAQPVVGICWYEARAYCSWLSAQTGQMLALPSEVEWEAAARGTAARRYAWGEDFDAGFCNAFETHVRGTTPVGVFPGGDTPEGLVDISGNVYEWTSSAFHSYPYAADVKREDPEQADARRVLRGGGWNHLRDFARCAFRGHYDPGVRLTHVGLRLVCVSPILKR